MQNDNDGLTPEYRRRMQQQEEAERDAKRFHAATPPTLIASQRRTPNASPPLESNEGVKDQPTSNGACLSREDLLSFLELSAEERSKHPAMKHMIRCDNCRQRHDEEVRAQKQARSRNGVLS